MKDTILIEQELEAMRKGEKRMNKQHNDEILDIQRELEELGEEKANMIAVMIDFIGDMATTTEKRYQAIRQQWEQEKAGGTLPQDAANFLTIVFDLAEQRRLEAATQ